MTTRFGVDVGGTFTDCVLYDEASGTVYVDKAPTVPAAPEAGVLAVVRDGVPAAALAQAELFLHGTTVGINALLERSGARVGLLTTRGFRDVLEMRRGERDALYDITWTPPPPLVPRRFRLPVTERIAASGAIEIPLDEADIERNLAVFRSGEIEAIAIVFINAYANPIHEQAAERILRDQGFTGEISLSSAVSGEYREYERTSTTVVDAYVRPKVSGYLARLERELITVGFAGASLITRSGGGAMPFAQASGRPVETIMSGPVAGAAGAAGLCRRLEIDQAITADVGGTSFDTCLIVDGQPQRKFEGLVDGMPLQLPWIEARARVRGRRATTAAGRLPRSPTPRLFWACLGTVSWPAVSSWHSPRPSRRLTRYPIHCGCLSPRPRRGSSRSPTPRWPTRCARLPLSRATIRAPVC